MYGVRTLLQSQILYTISHSEFLALMPKVFIRSCLDYPSLLIFGQTNPLKSLVDIETEIPLFIEMLSPSSYKLPFCLFSFRRDTDERLGKLEHLVVDRSFTRFSRPDRSEERR